MPSQNTKEQIKMAVRQHYKNRVTNHCRDADCGKSSSCCTGKEQITVNQLAQAIGYSQADLHDAPETSNLGLGCGNPQAIADLKPGETILDLGSGAGFDAFLAARRVGKTGRVIGVDMTPEMVSRARENAHKAGVDNVEFYLGEIEKLPIADNSVDVIISNCVINLSPEKDRVFQEAFRVLKPGGRLAIADMVGIAPMPKQVREDLAAISCCIGGAEQVGTIETVLEKIGFRKIRIILNEQSKHLLEEWLPGEKIGRYVASAQIQAVKP